MVDSVTLPNKTVKTNREQNFFNPLATTERDLARTQELAGKNLLLVVLGGLILSPIGSSLYLGRGINFLKIFAYMIVISFTVGASVSERETAKNLGEGIGRIAGSIAIMEQVGAVKKARKRLSQNK